MMMSSSGHSLLLTCMWCMVRVIVRLTECEDTTMVGRNQKGWYEKGKDNNMISLSGHDILSLPECFCQSY